MSTETLIIFADGSVEAALTSFSTLASSSALRPARTTEAPARAQTEDAAYKRIRSEKLGIIERDEYCSDAAVGTRDDDNLASLRV